jgi:hypothetical protein
MFGNQIRFAIRTIRAGRARRRSGVHEHAGLHHHS